MPSFLPSCLWGSQRVALSTREQLVREKGGVGTVSDQMPYYGVNSSFFFFTWIPFVQGCLLGQCSKAWIMYIRFPPLHAERKRDLFYFNNLWLIIVCAADVCDSTQYCLNSFSFLTSVHILLIVWKNVCQNHQLGNKMKMRPHHYLS